MYCTRKGPVQPDHPQNGGQGAAGAHLGPRLISQCQIFCSLASFPSQSVGSGDTCLPGIHRGRSHTVLEEYCCQLGSPSPSVKALRQTFYSLAAHGLRDVPPLGQSGISVCGWSPPASSNSHLDQFIEHLCPQSGFSNTSEGLGNPTAKKQKSLIQI